MVWRDDFAEFLDRGEPARGLPPKAYLGDDIWRAECASVLRNTWVFAGFAHEMAAPGDVVPVTIAGQPVLLVRNAEGGIGGFHNVCRHRCLTLVEEPGNVGKLLRCPYHAWAYDLSGKLRAAPHFGGTGEQEPAGFDKTKSGLVPVRLHLWGDWIFCNLSGDAPAFRDYARPLIARLAGLDLGRLRHVTTLDFGVIETNWKLIMENFIEPYHVQFVHASTTDQPLEDHSTIVDGTCLGSAVDLDEEAGTDGSLGVSSRYLTLFPNFIIGWYFPDQVGVYHNVPLGPGRIAQRRAIYSTRAEAMTPDEVAGLRQLWWDVHKEDHAIVERMLRGRASDAARDGGVLSPVWEDSVRAFQDLVVAELTKGTGQ